VRESGGEKAKGEGRERGAKSEGRGWRRGIGGMRERAGKVGRNGESEWER